MKVGTPQFNRFVTTLQRKCINARSKAEKLAKKSAIISLLTIAPAVYTALQVGKSIHANHTGNDVAMTEATRKSYGGMLVTGCLAAAAYDTNRRAKKTYRYYDYDVDRLSKELNLCQIEKENLDTKISTFKFELKSNEIDEQEKNRIKQELEALQQNYEKCNEQIENIQMKLNLVCNNASKAYNIKDV